MLQISNVPSTHRSSVVGEAGTKSLWRAEHRIRKTGRGGQRLLLCLQDDVPDDRRYLRGDPAVLRSALSSDDILAKSDVRTLLDHHTTSTKTTLDTVDRLLVLDGFGFFSGNLPRANWISTDNQSGLGRSLWRRQRRPHFHSAARSPHRGGGSGDRARRSGDLL